MSSIGEFCYQLPLEQLEGTPREIRLGRRDLGRMMVIDRATATVRDAHVSDLPGWFEPGDVLLLNNSKRLPGVLDARTRQGGKVELRFVELDAVDTHAGLCSIFPDHDAAVGSMLFLADGTPVTVVERGVSPYGLSQIKIEATPLRSALKRLGRPIAGFFYDGHWTCENLNPFYASEEGSVESPLAGLHFTPDLIAEIEARGASVCFVTLHSVGSWLPFLEGKLEEHVMWREQYRVPAETARAVNDAHGAGRRVVACGSTSLRAIETTTGPDGVTIADIGRTSLYITPGYRFRAVDGYFTNFHQQQTSMIVLDAAFGGRDLVMSAYRHAADRGYGFFEFGDAVLIT